MAATGTTAAVVGKRAASRYLASLSPTQPLLRTGSSSICYTFFMQSLYPLCFDLTALTQDYLWGGDKLKALVPGFPADQPLAELWLVSDRPTDQRVGTIQNGPLASTTLRTLMEQRPEDIVGRVPTVAGQFPLLVKLLDAKQQLSLQVHPPETAAKQLGGEPKTECWTILAGSDEQASLYAGLKPGVTRAEFETTLRTHGDLEPLLHILKPNPGDCLFLPSGRLHAVGAGSLVYEVQQCSNTTYRVFDWNRVDQRTGQQRELHIDQALASIDFQDAAPAFQHPQLRHLPNATVETLVDCPYFTLERWTTQSPQTFTPAANGSFEVMTVLEGSAVITGNSESVTLRNYGTALVPAELGQYEVATREPLTFLRTFVRA